MEGEDHPRWSGGKAAYDCAACGETVERYPSRTGEVTTCDEGCRAEWLSEAFTGEGHPNWEGGDVGPYGPGWSRVRREALERDDHECQHCGKTREEIGRNPDVHHIVPVRAFAAAGGRERADAHRLDNVVSLCVDCHRKADFGEISKERLRSYVATGAETDVAGAPKGIDRERSGRPSEGPPAAE
jgi:ribosomal protein L37AE/L43A